MSASPRRPLPTTFYLVEAIDREGDAFLYETTPGRCSKVDVAIDLLEGQYDRFPIARILSLNVSEGTSEDATEEVLAEVCRLADLTRCTIPESVRFITRDTLGTLRSGIEDEREEMAA